MGAAIGRAGGDGILDRGPCRSARQLDLGAAHGFRSTSTQTGVHREVAVSLVPPGERLLDAGTAQHPHPAPPGFVVEHLEDGARIGGRHVARSAMSTPSWAPMTPT